MYILKEPANSMDGWYVVADTKELDMYLRPSLDVFFHTGVGEENCGYWNTKEDAIKAKIAYENKCKGIDDSYFNVLFDRDIQKIFNPVIEHFSENDELSVVSESVVFKQHEQEGKTMFTVSFEVENSKGK